MITVQQWLDHFIPFEQRVSNFYQDGEGIITVGIGCRAFDPTKLPFLRKSDNATATDVEIMADFQAVSQQRKGFRCEYYGTFCSLYMPESAVNSLFESRKDQIIKEIETAITPLAPFPDLAQMVLVDFGFNLGVDRFRRGFTNFINCLLKQPPDYHGAALESHRLKIQESRNKWAFDALESLAAR